MVRSVETLRQIMAIDRVGYRIIYSTFQEWLKALHKVYRSIERQPAKVTANALAKEIGRTEANVLIGSIINCYAFDEHIDQSVIDWAENIEGVCDGNAAHMLALDKCKIHLAHINQIAFALMAHRKN